jgi:hypothetical protein
MPEVLPKTPKLRTVTPGVSAPRSTSRTVVVVPTPPKPSQNKSSPILDITERIGARKMGRDEVILFPPRQRKEGGPCYLGIIRLGDGRYFSIGVWKFDSSLHQLRLRQRQKGKGNGNIDNGARAVCWLEQQPLEPGSPHYRSGFYLNGEIYRVTLWVRSWGEKKVLEVKLTPGAVEKLMAEGNAPRGAGKIL